MIFIKPTSNGEYEPWLLALETAEDERESRRTLLESFMDGSSTVITQNAGPTVSKFAITAQRVFCPDGKYFRSRPDLKEGCSTDDGAYHIQMSRLLISERLCTRLYPHMYWNFNTFFWWRLMAACDNQLSSGVADDSWRATAIAQALNFHTCFELQSIHYCKVQDGSTEERILTLPEKISRWQSEWQKYDSTALVSGHLLWTLV